jgi:5-methylcytosine-specific restriction endonuclease McrA
MPRDPEKQREAQRRYKERNREKVRARDRENKRRNAERGRAYSREYRAKHREELLARRKLHREANREELNAKARAAYAANKDKERERWQRYYAANKERLIQYRIAWAKAHEKKEREIRTKRYERDKASGRSSERFREWRLANPEKCRARTARRKARKVNAPGGGWKAKDIEVQYKAQRGRCLYCKAKLGREYHCDHIIPLNRGGAHCRSNLAISCPTCNVRKSDRDPQDFAGILL